MAQEWRTSADETKTRMCLSTGSVTRLSTSKSRKLAWEGDVTIYDSNPISGKSGKLYSQYHWCPKVVSDMSGCSISSIIYKSRREGKAINRSNSPGKIVHHTSREECSVSESMGTELVSKSRLMAVIKPIIRTITRQVWSWKYSAWAIIRELVFWKPIADQ